MRSLSTGLPPVLVAVVLAVSLHAILVAPFRLTFLADDYNLLAAARQPGGLTIGSFGAYWSRVPVWSLVTWAVFRSGVWERTWLPMHAFFACHAAAIAILLRWWLARTGVPCTTALFALITAVVALQPNAYEVLYWPTDMAYTLGALLLALGVTARRTWMGATALVLSFLTLETFVLPALALALLDRSRHRLAWRDWDGEIASAANAGADGLRAWMLAIVGYGATRLVLGWIVPYPYHVALAPTEVLSNLAEAAGGLFLIHFRKPQWPASILQALVLAGVARWLVRRGRWTWRPPALAALACFASTGAYWILAYSAPRALYGSGVLFAVLAGWLLHLHFHSVNRRRFAWGALALLAATYIGQEIAIFSIKDHNTRTLAVREERLGEAMRHCAAPCTLSVGALDRDLEPDWLLPRPYWDAYLAWVQSKHAPGKSIAFRLPEPAGSGTNAAPDRGGR